MIENAAGTPEKTVSPPSSPQAAPPARRTGIYTIVLLILVAAVLGLFVYRGIGERVSAESTLVKETHAAEALDVAITHPKVVGGALDLILPGNTQPFSDAPIYARTNGYLSKWYLDIGAHVRKGDLMAEIQSPEIDAQLLQAKANLATANANLALAQTQATRWQSLIKTNAVSQDELDQKLGALNAGKAIVTADEANVRNLQDLVSFEKVTAPFDGVVTARHTDVGALIGAGAGASAQELFHVAAIDRLRVFVNVPEQDRRAAQSGVKASLFLTEFPGRTFTGTIARDANSIDPASRTLLTEIDVDNADGKLLPGAYVSVHLKLPGAANALTVPANAILFRAEGLRVALVKDGKAELRPVHVGRDFGDSLEIVDGLAAGDSLILNPPDSLVSGAAVRVLQSDKQPSAK